MEIVQLEEHTFNTLCMYGSCECVYVLRSDTAFQVDCSCKKSMCPTSSFTGSKKKQVWPFWAASAIKTAIEIFPFLFQFYFILFFFLLVEEVEFDESERCWSRGNVGCALPLSQLPIIRALSHKTLPQGRGKRVETHFGQTACENTRMLLIAGFDF